MYRWRKFANNFFIGLTWAASLVVIVVLAYIILYITAKGVPHVNLEFITGWPKGFEARGGILPIIVATFYLTIFSALIVTPVAVGGAIYLSEYSHPASRFSRIIRFAADTLSTVPSIVYGIFGFAFFVVYLGFGWSMLSGSLTLALMILPLVLRSTEEAILDVPRGYREASYALGATRWQTISRVVLKAAAPRIITGIILGMGRAFGETAAVMLTAGMAISLPVSIFDGGRNMSSHLYLLATEGISLEAAFGTAFLLLIIILIFNLSAKRIARRV